MLIKSADDKSRRLKLLEELQHSPVLDQKQKDWLRKELKNLRAGIKGEKDAAYYIDTYYRDSQNWAVLHDLRFKVDGEVAQIDHLLVGRTCMIALETKNFNGNVSINEYGEFSVSYASGETYGIPSPLEQSKRHEKLLRKLLDSLKIRTRIGTPMEIEHVVLFHPQSIIQRPDSKKFNTGNIIKADGLRAWHDRFTDKKTGVVQTFAALANVRGSETVREWAEKITLAHEPEDLLRLPDFMAPKYPAASLLDRALESDVPNVVVPPTVEPVCAACNKPLTTVQADYCRKKGWRFGGKLYCYEHQAAFPTVPVSAFKARAKVEEMDHQASSEIGAGAKRPVCATCGDGLEERVVRYCRNHAQRFGGALYCREHQKAF